MNNYLTHMTHWSHACWGWLHSCENMNRRTITSLARILPCGMCRHHMQQYLKEHEITEPVDKWIIDFHNDINIRLHKPLMSYEDVSLQKKSRVDMLNCLVQFTLACSFVFQFNPSSREDFINFFEDATEATGLPLFVDTDGSDGDLLPHKVHEYFTQHGVVSRSYVDMVDDYIPMELKGRFMPMKSKSDSTERNDMLVTLPIVLLALSTGILILMSIYHHYNKLKK